MTATKLSVAGFVQGVLASLLPRLVASILAHTLRPANDTPRPGDKRPY